ncbi:MAG: tetratricopeptide repeat protein, partial [Planctomycetes bacterium]|nr:tetratricopeptide repeat protein [Planctomycetota bacterium]
ENMTDFSQVEVRLRPYRVSTGKLGPPQIWKPGGRDVVLKIQLADNLRNEIERRRRAVRPGDLDGRAKLVEWLLEKAREEVSVYKDARAQADLYAQESGNNLDGIRLQLRVVRAEGALADEFALLDGIDAQNRESAVRYVGLGRLSARLGLWQDAERDLRKAVVLGAQDAHAHAALAEFLLGRGRTREAVAAANAAKRTFGSLLDLGDKASAVKVIVGCFLAVGDLESAKAARALVSTGESYLLDGAIAYAEGDVDAALLAFRRGNSATESGAASRGEAKLGEAACLLRAGQWQEAHDVLLGVHDERPLLRHRAAAGLALLYQKIGEFELAVTWADRALEANPQFAYAQYLRGRALRLSGQYAGAEEAFKAALQLNDDFGHAILELATLYATRAENEFGPDQDRLIRDAMKYGDRAVALSPLERPELLQFQGMRHFTARDRVGSIAAFSKAQQAASLDADKLFAKGALAVVDYSRGRVDDARAVLLRMVEDLGKDDPVRVWAESTVDAIDLHAQKEKLEDRFERRDLGSTWPTEHYAGLVVKVDRGRLVFEGTLSRNAENEVWAERASAVKKAMNFLAVGVTMQLRPDHAPTGFVGLRITTQQGSTGRTDSRIEVGVRDGQPTVAIIDNKQPVDRPEVDVPDFDPAGEQDLELRVLPRGDDQGRSFLLQVSWNGRVIHVRELKSLNGAVQSELKTVLFVQGSRGGKVDVAFDNYRLERKKE